MAGCQMLGPDDEGYGGASISWNAAFVHRPALAALPTSATEVAEAVTYAAEHDLPIAVQSTGHGAERSYDGALLINTSRMRDLRIDPGMRTARVGAGVWWQELLEAAGPHGLAALAGTCMSVGEVGASDRVARATSSRSGTSADRGPSERAPGSPPTRASTPFTVWRSPRCARPSRLRGPT